MRKTNKHVGSGLDDFLASEGLLEEATAIAVKRLIAWKLADAMKAKGISKKALAQRIRTSRTQLDRVLDDESSSLTLETLTKVASALGFRVNVELLPIKA